MAGNPAISPPFIFNAGINRYSNTQLDLLDKILLAVAGGSPNPPVDPAVFAGFETGWVIDQAGVIHWLEITLVEGSQVYTYYDSPGGTETTPTGMVRPTELPFIRTQVVRLEGTEAIQVGIPWIAPRQGVAGSSGTPGRRYIIQPGFRYFQIVALPQAVLGTTFTVNGLAYTLQFGDYAGTPLPQRGDPSLRQKIDEQYTIIAGDGCFLEVLEVR